MSESFFCARPNDYDLTTDTGILLMAPLGGLGDYKSASKQGQQQNKRPYDYVWRPNEGFS